MYIGYWTLNKYYYYYPERLTVLKLYSLQHRRETAVEINLATEELKNILSSVHFFPLINKPTRERKHSLTIIDNIPNTLEKL